MGVVIVQSRATAHVYRMFGALVALLLLMALAVGLVRVRSDREAASPYGSLRSVAATTEIPSLPSPIVPPAPVPAPAILPAPAATVPAVPRTAVAEVPGAAITAAQDAAVPATGTPPVAANAAPLRSASAAVASSAPRPASDPASPAADPASPAADPVRTQPRQIALDQMASRSVTPQPAPPAVVAAATRAAAAPPVVRAPAPARAPQPAGVASGQASTEGAAAAPVVPKDGSSAGHVNINTASVEALNNVGAGHIGRTIAQHRPYRSLEDLVSRRILKARDFARIRSSIAID